jgi:predicted transposase YbfD/YdcC
MAAMDEAEYTTLVAALAAVPDPRRRRGQRYQWELLLVLIAAAVASGQTHGRGIGQWVRERAERLAELLGRPGARLPSEATLRRALRYVDVAALERRLGRFAAGLRPPGGMPRLRGQAIDGKAVRGARAHGRAVHLVGLARHDGVVLAQAAVEDKANEIVAAPRLLADRDLRGTVTTVDALLAQRALARRIRARGGHYLMAVKDNQPETAAAIAELFEAPPWLARERAREYAVHRTVGKGHGRLETRVLEASPTLNGWLDWPAVGQVLRRRCTRVVLKTGAVSEEVACGVTSLRPEQASAAQLEALWRGHWTIENRVHYVRDVTLGEDAGQAHTGSTPRALAALRNATISLLRAVGWTNIADALRHYGAAAERALTLVGAIPAGL